MAKRNVSDLLNRLAAEEDRFLEREFLAPAVRGGSVRVRIGGIACRIRIQPARFTGWGVFQPISHRAARLVRPASMLERRRYLDLLPAVQQIVCRRQGQTWLAAPGRNGDSRIRFEGVAPLQLVDEVQLFDSVTTRFDGACFFFDEIDARRDPSAAAYLREEIGKRTLPEFVQRAGLTAEERAAYELHFVSTEPSTERKPRGEHRVDVETDSVVDRLRESLSHAGAELVDYLERSDSYRVSYLVDGQRHTTSVNKTDLTVQVAGICLSGMDHRFDLASMVGVLREADGDGEVVRVGFDDGMDEEEYWQVHPPRP